MSPSLNDLARQFYKIATGWSDSSPNPPAISGGLPITQTPFEANSFGYSGTTAVNHTAGLVIVVTSIAPPAGLYEVLLQVASAGGTIANTDMVNYEFRVGATPILRPLSAIADSIGHLPFQYRFDGVANCGVYCIGAGSSGARVAASMTFTKIAN